MEVISIAQIKRDILRRRVYAFTTDIFFITIINKLIITTYVNIVGMTMFHYPYHIQKALISSLSAVQTLSLMSIFLLYFFVSYSLGQGQTLGKALFNLYVEGKNTRLTLWECAGRTIGYFVCYALGLVLYLVPFLRKDKRGIPDFFSRTQVKLVKPKKEQRQIDLFDQAA